ncbi:MAG: hypothetical protein RL745_928 [Actinomycetota bacterium]|jgi:hypothetical protein
MRRIGTLVAASVFCLAGAGITGCAKAADTATPTTAPTSTASKPTLGTWMSLSGFLKYRTDGLAELKSMTTALSQKPPTAEAEKNNWRINLFSSIKGTGRLMKTTGTYMAALKSPNPELNKRIKQLGDAYTDLGTFADGMDVAAIVSGKDTKSLGTLVSKVQKLSTLNKGITDYSSKHINDEIKL